MSQPVDARPGTPGASPQPDQTSPGANLGVATEQAQAFNAIYADLESYWRQLHPPTNKSVDYTLGDGAEIDFLWDFAETGIVELLEGIGTRLPSYGGSIPLPKANTAFIRFSDDVQGNVIRLGLTFDGMPDVNASTDVGTAFRLAKTDGIVGVFETKTDLDGTEEVLREKEVQLSPDQLRKISDILHKYSPSGAEVVLDADAVDPQTDTPTESNLSKPVVDIILKTRLEDIPDSPCDVCDGPTQKTFLELTNGAEVQIRAMNVAGYRCQDPECDITALSIEAVAEELTMASQILRNAGDIATAMAFERQRIVMENEIIARTPKAPDAP